MLKARGVEGRGEPKADPREGVVAVERPNNALVLA